MKKILINFALSLLFIISISIYASSPSYEVVSRCFFIYAPIFETGKDLKIQSLFLYGQKRIALVGGFIKAKEEDSDFKKVFEDNLSENKKHGTILERELRKAIKDGNKHKFETIMEYSVACDSEFGLKNTDTPKLHSL